MVDKIPQNDQAGASAPASASSVHSLHSLHAKLDSALVHHKVQIAIGLVILAVVLYNVFR